MSEVKRPDSLQSAIDGGLLSRWQAGEANAQERLHMLFDAAMAGQFDAIFREPAPVDSVSVTTSLHLLTLTLLNRLYGFASADFYKGDPQRYVRTTLLTQRLLGIRKLTLGWPVYAFGAECLGQVMMYPNKHAPGADPERPLINQSNWQRLGPPDLAGEIPRTVEEILLCFADLTGLEPVAHLPAPYSLAADIFGQEALISALTEAPKFVAELLDHLADQVFAPWIVYLVDRIPNVWIELSDASGSPMFISPQHFRHLAVPPVQKLISEYSWAIVFSWLITVVIIWHRLPALNSGAERVAGEAGASRWLTAGNRAAMQSLNSLRSNYAYVRTLSSSWKLMNCLFPSMLNKRCGIASRSIWALGRRASTVTASPILGPRKRIWKRRPLPMLRRFQTVSKSLAQDGQSRQALAWPGDIYIEDINAESDLNLVKTIIETVVEYGEILSQ